MATVSSANLALLECPVCLSIPRKEIFQCSNRHSICHICVSKVEICPICRVTLAGSEADRNFYAETILDGMKFPCCWMEKGCEVKIARDQLLDHENVCKYGQFNLCKSFKRSQNCQFEFSTMEFLETARKLDEVLNHMKYVHNCSVQSVALDKSFRWKMKFNYLESDIPTGLRSPDFVEVISRRNGQRIAKEPIALLVNLARNDQNQVLFSLAFANLTSERDGLKSNIKVKVSISTKMDTEAVKFWGDDCVSDLNWEVKAMDAMKLKEFLDMPLDRRPSFPFTMPVSHIKKYYTDQNGRALFRFSFHKE